MKKSIVTYGSGVDYRFLKPGIYVSRQYIFDGYIVCTTLDIRFKRPRDPMEGNAVMSSRAVHTIQHLGLAFLRSHLVWSDKVILFTPMACKTGFYLVLAGDYWAAKDNDIHKLIMDMCSYIVNFSGNIPDATPMRCGNCVEHDLGAAKRHTALYLKTLIKNPCFEYPTL